MEASSGWISETEAQALNSNEPGKKNEVMDPRFLFLNDTLWNESDSGWDDGPGESGYQAFPSEIISILEPRISSLTASERVELAVTYFAIGRVPSGKEQWEKAIASDSQADNAVGQHNLGEELVKGHAFDDALRTFARHTNSTHKTQLSEWTMRRFVKALP